MIEVVGICASLFVLASLLFKTNTYKGALALRLLNCVGSSMFIVYGFILPAYSTAFLNIAAVVINLYQAFNLKRQYKRHKQN